jgi:2,4-diaminopentanoate dehydrogenase
LVYPVVQWSTGSVGRLSLRELLKNPMFQLVGVLAHGKQKIGQDAGSLCGMPDTGVLAVGEVADLHLQPGDTILYCPMVADYDEIARLLRAGANVITTASNMYPQFYGPGVYDKLNDAALAGNATFHGSGVNPAFMSDVLPLTVSGLVHRARKITVREVSDVNHYASTAPEIMLDHVGMGKTPEEALNADAFLRGMTAYFSESILMICDRLGVKLDRIEEDHEVAVSKVRVVLENGRSIEPGTVGCRLFRWYGIVGGKKRIELSTFWKVTAELEPQWEVSSSGMVEWTVTIEGTPSVKTVISTSNSFDPENPEFMRGSEEAAMLATALHALNAVPVVVNAAPGVKTFLDLPIVASCGAFTD